MDNLFKIDASAGSGKTYSLTRRFLQLLARSDLNVMSHCGPRASGFSRKHTYNFSEILAVTFTNLAASQMQERVIQSLKKIALDQNDEGDDLWTKEEAKNALTQIFRQYSALNIKTIDSLLHYLVRVSALELEIPPQFDVTFDKTKIIVPLFNKLAQKALLNQGIVEENDTDLAELFYEACRSIIENRKEFNTFLAGDSFRNNCIDIVHTMLFSDAMNAHFKDNEDLNTQIDALEREFENYTGIISLDYFRERLEQIQKEIQNQFEFTSQEELIEIHSALQNEFYNTPKTLYKCMLDENLDVNKTFLKSFVNFVKGEYKYSKFHEKDSLDQCLNAKSKGKASQEAYALYLKMKENIYDFCALDLVVRNALQNFPMLALARQIEGDVWQYEKDNALLLASRMPSLVTKILRNDYHVSGAFCRMGANINHILLDEFQDTNHEQWEALEPLAREALGISGSVFFVGDMKQAIYGWRGGDAELFNQAPEALAPFSLGYTHKPLEYNWRSEAHIIEWNNAFFAKLSQKEVLQEALLFFEPELVEKLANNSDIQELYAQCMEKISKNYETVHQQIPAKRLEEKKKGLVQIHHINVPKKNINLASLSLIASSVQELHTRHEWQDICVLTITNAQASLVAQTLLSQGIPVVSQGSLLMAEHPVIIELIAFLRFLSNPLDEQALWQVLVSKNILPSPFHTKTLYDFVAKKRSSSLYKSFKESFPEIWELFFKPLIDGAGLMTAYDTLCEIYSRFEVRERNQDADIFLLRLLEIVHLAEENSHIDLGAFLSWWDNHATDAISGEKAPLPQNTGAVSVMTVHKSKGLEFGAVIIPWHNFNVEPDTATPQSIEYTYKDKKLRVFSKLIKEHGKPYYEKLFAKVLESINALYVAWTRPVKELHVFLPVEPAIRNKAFPLFLENILISLNIKSDKNIEIQDFDDYMSFGTLANTSSLAPTSLINPNLLRMLEFWFCKDDKTFSPVYVKAKDALLSQFKSIPEFETLESSELENVKSPDMLYYAKKISSVFSQIHKGSKAHFSETKAKQNDKSDITQNALLDQELLGELYLKKWERPMAWLPRMKVFRNDLQELRNFSVISKNKRGTLMHKCLENIIYSGDVENDVERAMQKVFSFLFHSRLNTQDSKKALNYKNLDLEEFRSALIWFLSQNDPFGGAKHWLRHGLKEHVLSNAKGAIFRVDLLVNRAFPSDTDENPEFMAIDYKTGYNGDLPDEKNVEQIKNYLNLLQEATHVQKNKVVGILVYLDRKKICLVNL